MEKRVRKRRASEFIFGTKSVVSMHRRVERRHEHLFSPFALDICIFFTVLLGKWRVPFFAKAKASLEFVSTGTEKYISYRLFGCRRTRKTTRIDPGGGSVLWRKYEFQFLIYTVDPGCEFLRSRTEYSFIRVIPAGTLPAGTHRFSRQDAAISTSGIIVCFVGRNKAGRQRGLSRTRRPVIEFLRHP